MSITSDSFLATTPAKRGSVGFVSDINYDIGAVFFCGVFCASTLDNPSQAALHAFSELAPAVFAESSTNYAVVGVATHSASAGVVGLGQGASGGVGVQGLSKSDHGIFGQCLANDKAGVFGQSDVGRGVIGQAVDNDGVLGAAVGKGIAVRGFSVAGYGGQFEGRLAPLRLVPGDAPGAPTGDHKRGEFYVDSNGVLFFCQNDGNPGDWKQVQLL